MKHESVLALQADILQEEFDFQPADTVVEVAGLASSVTAAAFSTFPAMALVKPPGSRSRRVETDRIALGVGRRAAAKAGAKDGFELVVLVQTRAAMQSALIDRIADRAKKEVRVEFTGPIQALGPAWHMTGNRPLRLGASAADLMPGVVHTGTLGFFATDNTSVPAGATGIVSNNHVLAGNNRTPPGTPVTQPGPLDGGAAADRIATLTRFIPMTFGGTPNLVDAAFATLDRPAPALLAQEIHDTGGHLVLSKAPGLTAPAGIGDEVHKIGRSTGLTYGEVFAVNVMNVSVAYGSKLVRFDNQIQLESRNRNRFSMPGDSGSLIVNSAGAAIGLLFAGGAQGGTHGSGFTFANPIDDVLNLLNVTLI